MADNNSPSKSALIISLVIGIVGFATAIITNARDLREFYRAVTIPQTSRVPGTWTGIFREYVSGSSQEGIATELVRLNMANRTLGGEITTSENKIREWKVSGEVMADDSAIIINYVTKDPKRQSIGAYVLNYRASEHAYFGYWLGYDPDLQNLVAYPYILTHDEAHVAKTKYAAYLKQPALNWKAAE